MQQHGELFLFAGQHQDDGLRKVGIFGYGLEADVGTKGLKAPVIVVTPAGQANGAVGGLQFAKQGIRRRVQQGERLRSAADRFYSR